MKVFGFPDTRSTRVLWALEEANASYEYTAIDLRKGEARKPEYLAVNPGGKLPAFIDGDLTLTESAAICIYIADKFPTAHLAPPHGSNERARMNQWCFFALSELEQALWTINKHLFALPKEYRIPPIMDTARFEFARALKVLETGLGTYEYILGNNFSVADILIAHTLHWARLLNAKGLSKVEIASATINNYADRLLSRPALVRALARERAASGM
ncbi:MAG TPA: glutathione S-transferase family protein [Steroidobacteraceae bacterium]|nr:glutathione S-transferase family protein [Steroidobacteraceae bacterium]